MELRFDGRARAEAGAWSSASTHTELVVQPLHRGENESRGRLGDTATSLALERTLLAWIRTGIALMGFGFVVARFALLLHDVTGRAPTRDRSVTASLTGVGLVGAGMLLNVWAGIRHARMLRDLASGKRDAITARGPLAVTVGSALGGGILILVILGVLGQ